MITRSPVMHTSLENIGSVCPLFVFQHVDVTDVDRGVAKGGGGGQGGPPNVWKYLYFSQNRPHAFVN